MCSNFDRKMTFVQDINLVVLSPEPCQSKTERVKLATLNAQLKVDNVVVFHVLNDVKNSSLKMRLSACGQISIRRTRVKKAKPALSHLLSG